MLQVFRTMLDAERHFCDEGQAPPTLRALHFQPPGENRSSDHVL